MTEFLQSEYVTPTAIGLGLVGYVLAAWRQSASRWRAFTLLRDVRVQLYVVGASNGGALGNIVQNIQSDKEVAPHSMRHDEACETDFSGRNRYVLDSLLLLTCYRHLFGEASMGERPGEFAEVFAYLSSVRLNERTYVLTNLVPLRFEQQWAGGVRVDQPNNIETFAALDRLGVTLGAHLHSHSGRSGPQSTYPSSTDRRFQARLEQGGSAAIGLIFARSLDGNAYVRFFAGEETDFEVQVQGEYVERIEGDDHVFKISLDNSDLSLSTIVAS